MTAALYSRIVRHDWPGEVRAALLDQAGRPCSLFLQRWGGAHEPARWGSTHAARVRAFADSLRGAFLELASGEEVFLRLKSRDGITEGMELSVQVISRARSEKLARVRIVAGLIESPDAFQAWAGEFGDGEDLSIDADPDAVMAAFEEATTSSITLPQGGRLHVDRTRALTAFDVDTSGRVGKGSAGARALAINREAVSEVVRQIRLRGLGGNVVLDCVGPLNKDSAGLLKDAGQDALSAYGVQGGKVLAPSSLGMMEMSFPWTETPIADLLSERPAETGLLSFLAEAQREATANASAFFQVQLSKSVWQAYLDRKTETDAALKAYFGGRVTLAQSELNESRVQRV